MLQIIKGLLQNAQLQQQVKEATNLAEAIKLITNAGAEKGYFFTQESLAQVVSRLMLEEHELTEADLLAVAGGAQSFTSWKSFMSLCFYFCSGSFPES